MATEKEITKAQKQFEKEKDNLIQYAKEFKRFFTFSKRSPNFNIIYSSAISGFEKKPLYDTIKVRILGYKTKEGYNENLCKCKCRP